MSHGGAESITALLTQRDCFAADSARLVHLAQNQEGFGEGRLPLSKDELRADPFGQREALLDERSPAARVPGPRVSPRLPELHDVDAEQVARTLGNTPRALVVGDRARAFAPLVVETSSVLIGGSLREGVLDLLGQLDTAVGVGQGPVELAGRCEEQGGEARCRRLLALVPEPGHLLDASLNHSARLGGIRPPVSPGHEIDRRGRKDLVAQPVGNRKTLLGVLDRPRRVTENVLEPSKPVERAGQPPLVLMLLGQIASALDVPLIALDVLPRQSNRRKLERGVDLEAVRPRRGRQRPRDRERVLVVRCSLGVRVEAGGLVPGEERVLDRLLLSLAPGVVVGENRRVLLQAIGVEVLDRLADRSVQLLPACASRPW